MTPRSPSICDALLAPTPGVITFAIHRRLLAGGLVASDAEIRRAMAVAFAELKLVVEPGGRRGTGHRALRADSTPKAMTVAVIASGGNVEREMFIEALAGA